MSSALIPGSFDPITLGHLDIITRAAARFDKVTVAVMNNDMQKYVQGAPVKQYAFALSERREMAEAACAHLPNVEVISAGGMLIDLFDRLGADAVCKGWRNQKDYDYELHMADWNSSHNPRCFHIYISP